MTCRGLTCREVVELATDHFEAALPAPDRERFAAHVAGCPGCQAYLASAPHHGRHRPQRRRPCTGRHMRAARGLPRVERHRRRGCRSAAETERGDRRRRETTPLGVDDPPRRKDAHGHALSRIHLRAGRGCRGGPAPVGRRLRRRRAGAEGRGAPRLPRRAESAASPARRQREGETVGAYAGAAHSGREAMGSFAGADGARRRGGFSDVDRETVTTYRAGVHARPRRLAPQPRADARRRGARRGVRQGGRRRAAPRTRAGAGPERHGRRRARPHRSTAEPSRPGVTAARPVGRSARGPVHRRRPLPARRRDAPGLVGGHRARLARRRGAPPARRGRRCLPTRARARRVTTTPCSTAASTRSTRTRAVERMEAAYASAGIDRFAAWVHESDERMRHELEARGYTLDTATRAMGMVVSDVRLPRPELDLEAGRLAGLPALPGRGATAAGTARRRRREQLPCGGRASRRRGGGHRARA